MPKVPERKPTEWELKQKPKPKTIICWATPRHKQAMFKTKSV